jgi:ATP-dependent Lhr-like helicase
MVLSRVSPLAVPVLLDIGRESVRTDTDEDALLAEAEAIIAEATGEAEPPYVPAVLRPNLNRRSSGAQTTLVPKRARDEQADLFR